MYLNFGDLGQNAKEYVEQFASKTQSSHQLESIADMKRFIEDYPEFRKLSGNVTKHVTLVGELSRRVGEDNLLDVSELEQSLACLDNHNTDLKVSSGQRDCHSPFSDKRIAESPNFDPEPPYPTRQQAPPNGNLRPPLLQTPL